MTRFLVVGPHPDDQELGMGGTIALLARGGHEVHLLDVTDGEPTPRGSPETRRRESAEAAAILGVGRSLLTLPDGRGLPNREVVHSLEARHAMAAAYRRLRPEVVFLPFPVDAHPDHVAVTRIGEDARFDAKLTRSRIPGEPWHPKRIIHYFCTHLRLSIQPQFCVDISGTFDLKSRAIACYASQFEPEGVPAMVRDMNAYFGGRIGTSYAEPFASHEVIGLSGLGELV
jgi:bacillithiol biosynthesis deacetylase BshB1